MLVSLAWLRALCAVDAEVDRIAAALTARGLTVDAVEASRDDHTLDIDIPANRPDCLGHLGISRELAAAFGAALAPRPDLPAGEGAPTAEDVRVEIEDPIRCARFTACLVRGVRVGPSPAWVAARLEACGVRSISNVVDASNLVMLETGNPIHFYDLATVTDGTLVVRLAKKGEQLTTLDGEERKLDPEMLVIADPELPVGLAGVMGGAATEIGSTTRDVLVEAAWFDPAAVRLTARRLGMQTDASHRFGRGVDPEGPAAAQALAVRLLVELAGGKPAPGMVDRYPGPRTQRSLTLRRPQLGRLLGYQPSTKATDAALAALQLEPAPVGDDSVEVRVPSWRVDLEREVDLVEEVARHLGYDEIPSEATGMPTTAIPPSRDPLEERVRERMAHLGFHEAFGYAMIGAGDDSPFVDPGLAAPMRLTNPIAESLCRLRRSILPGLVRAADLNQRRGVRDVRLFEVGHVFHGGAGGELPDEPRHLAIAWSGAGHPPHWQGDNTDVDLHDMMGLVEGLLLNLGANPLPRPSPGAFPGFHPGRSATWPDADGRPVAWCGALHPEIQQALAQPLYLAELDLERVADDTGGVARYSPVPRLTAVTRDLALVLTAETPYAEVVGALESVEAPARASFEAVDRYVGPPLADGEASLTVRVLLQPSERTLTDAEIDGYRLALIERLRTRLGVEIRG
jgi:phenylalanyl-tRNA synthetase beta chain